MKTTSRWLPVFAALCCGLSVALGAYASHGAQGQARERLALAAAFAFAHGLAILALRSRASRVATVAKWLFAAGIVLFSGSLASAALFASATTAAPFGGSLLMLGWVLMAGDFLRDE